MIHEMLNRLKFAKLYLPAYHLVLSEGVSKVEHANMRKRVEVIGNLGAVHDKRLGTVGDIIYIDHYILIASKLPQQILHK